MWIQSIEQCVPYMFIFIHAVVLCIAALEVVWNPLLQKVRSGLDSSKRWTKEEYSFVVRLLLAADHAAVPESAVQRGLGDEAGEL